MNNLKVSIVVPVYNVDKYVYQFCDSLFFQLNNLIELIIVNDGSTDNSLNIIIDFINKNGDKDNFKNIKIINQDNLGVSEARNTGVKNANSEYITFVDPDDTVEPNYISKILDLIVSDKDIYTFNANRIDAEGKNNGLIEVFEKDKEDLLESVFLKGMWFLWARVFKKKLFENISFKKDQRYEDLMLVPELYLLASSFEVSSSALVNYRLNTGSITLNPEIGDLETLISFYKLIDNKLSLEHNVVSQPVNRLYCWLLLSILKSIYFVGIKLYGHSNIYLISKKISVANIKKSTIYKDLDQKNKFILRTPLVYSIIYFVKGY